MYSSFVNGFWVITPKDGHMHKHTVLQFRIHYSIQYMKTKSSGEHKQQWFNVQNDIKRKVRKNNYARNLLLTQNVIATA